MEHSDGKMGVIYPTFEEYPNRQSEEMLTNILIIITFDNIIQRYGKEKDYNREKTKYSINILTFLLMWQKIFKRHCNVLIMNALIGVCKQALSKTL